MLQSVSPFICPLIFSTAARKSASADFVSANQLAQQVLLGPKPFRACFINAFPGTRIPTLLHFQYKSTPLIVIIVWYCIQCTNLVQFPCVNFLNNEPISIPKSRTVSENQKPWAWRSSLSMRGFGVYIVPAKLRFKGCRLHLRRIDSNNFLPLYNDARQIRHALFWYGNNTTGPTFHRHLITSVLTRNWIIQRQKGRREIVTKPQTTGNWLHFYYWRCSCSCYEGISG